jgi:hypothetical protein
MTGLILFAIESIVIAVAVALSKINRFTDE